MDPSQNAPYPMPAETQKPQIPKAAIGCLGFLSLIPFLGIPFALTALTFGFTRKSKALLIIGALGILFTLLIFFNFKFHWGWISYNGKKNPPNSSQAAKIISQYEIPYEETLNYCPRGEYGLYTPMKTALENPKSVCALRLEVIDLASPAAKYYDNRLNNLEDLKKFSNLKILNVSLYTSSFPDQILKLTQLEALTINIYPNSIQQLPDFSSLKNLQVLKINSSSKFPALLKVAGKLRVLVFSGEVAVLPMVTSDLTSLEALGVNKGEWEGVRPVFPSLKKLQILTIINENLPSEIFEITAIQSLTFVSELKSFPSELSRLPNLKYLSIVGKFTEIPDSISQFSNLEVLKVSDKVTKISPEIRNLKNLKILDVRGSPIANDRKAIEELDKLLPNTRIEIAYPMT